MSERPIIFSAPMIRALLEGRKTQTRRIIKLPREFVRPDMGGWTPTTNGGPGTFTFARDGSRVPVAETVGIWNQTTGTCFDAPYQEGDRLWVREAWRAPAMNDEVAPRDLSVGMAREFEADGEQLVGAGKDAMACPIGAAGRLRPSIFIPRWASRLTLAVTGVRIERLKDISEVDAIAEGIERSERFVDRFMTPSGDYAVPIVAFQRLWESIHGADAWDTNPWVAAVTFEVHRANIDALPTTPVAPNLAQGGETP